ncbi:MAG: SHOCT domain-containing protein [Oscillospiraceae bacterium]|nr:SHOCT domain-containing protein [Oscillospiraceae bacterium]
MISAYSTKKFCSVIAVATASGITKFALIGNYKEISEVLAKRIREVQQPVQTNTQATSGNTSLDDLVKLKSLLDSGIISQEEFDSKKKQLLGL